MCPGNAPNVNLNFKFPDLSREGLPFATRNLSGHEGRTGQEGHFYGCVFPKGARG